MKHKRIIATLLVIVTVFFAFTACTKNCTHQYDDGKVTTSATCERTGVKTFTCKKCGDTRTETIEKTSHQYDDGKVTTSATCERAGIKTFTCKNCGGEYADSFTTLSASEVYELSKNSVGEIIIFDKKGVELALGTGFVYSSDGKIVTNYHVIEDAYSATITINEIKYQIESVLAYDKNIDLAVLQINAKDLDVLRICDKKHSVGETVYAFGSSKGFTATFSRGIITSADRELNGVHYVQHDAAISGGNSGGPLINQYGEIIGINTLTIKDSQNLNFAISVGELSNLKYDTALTMKEFYEKECDVFLKMKNYAIQKGQYEKDDNTYEFEIGYSYSSDYANKYTRVLYYDAANDEIRLYLFIDSDYLFALNIDEVDGVYPWTLVDTHSYYMQGILSGATFTSNTLLGYTSNNLPSSLRSSFRELASSMAKYLILTMYDDLAPIGVKPENLGFVNF